MIVLQGNWTISEHNKIRSYFALVTKICIFIYVLTSMNIDLWTDYFFVNKASSLTVENVTFLNILDNSHKLGSFYNYDFTYLECWY